MMDKHVTLAIIVTLDEQSLPSRTHFTRFFLLSFLRMRERQKDVTRRTALCLFYSLHLSSIYFALLI